jgi:putative inorganic carbon (HCO3(-)) transporter
MTHDRFPRRLLSESVIFLLVALLVAIPLLDPFTHGNTGRAVRNGVFQGIGILLLMLLFARRGFRSSLLRLLVEARSGVNAPLAAFLLWAGLGVLRAPDRPFAMGELLRLGSVALIYYATVLHIEAPAQLTLLINCLLGTVIVLIGFGFIYPGSGATTGFLTVFRDFGFLSAILTVLFPLLAGLALGLRDRERRRAAVPAAILAASGLLLGLERSAWIAIGFGMLVWLFLSNRAAPRSAQNWRPALVVAVCGLLVAAGVFAVTGVGAAVTDRARKLPEAWRGRDSSFAWRVQKWRGTVAMAAQRPVWGWGPGQYVLYQYPFTHIGSYPGHAPRTVREDVRRYGASLDDMAYNEYLQMAAELGLPGLALYLLLLACFFSKSVRALPRLPPGLRRTTLVGCMASVAAQMVDAMANVGWRYSECSVFFWLILGLGMAVTRTAYRTADGKSQIAAADPTENERIFPLGLRFLWEEEITPLEEVPRSNGGEPAGASRLLRAATRLALLAAAAATLMGQVIGVRLAAPVDAATSQIGDRNSACDRQAARCIANCNGNQRCVNRCQQQLISCYRANSSH